MEHLIGGRIGIHLEFCIDLGWRCFGLTVIARQTV